MRRKEFKTLLETANHIVNPNKSSIPLNEGIEYVNEGFQQGQYELVNAISEILEETEKQLNITLSDQEIQETTNFIVETAANELLIEHIQNDVGFVLTEEEQRYVLEQIHG